VVCVPGSAFEAGEAVGAVVAHEGPAYLRLERAAPDFADDPRIPFQFGRARRLRDGADLTLVGAGGVVAEVVSAARALERDGIHCRVLSMHSLKPLDADSLLAAAVETGGILTVEENTVLGGLGGAVAEICLESVVRPKRFLRLGIADTHISIVGDQKFLRTHVGIDCKSIEAAVRQLVSVGRDRVCSARTHEADA